VVFDGRHDVPETWRPFRQYAPYLRERYGATTYRVAVDAGFTCPGRDTGVPCKYCDARGSRAGYLDNRNRAAAAGGRVGRSDEPGSLEDQIARATQFLKQRYSAERFMLYFQAFSNTYAPTEELRRTYDEGLSHGDFTALIVGTRPDCIDQSKARLLAEYQERDLDVWVELGLQSANDATLERIGRGHTVEQFDRAVDLLSRYGVHVAAHLILGLPGEGREEAVASTRHLSRLPVEGVKFHNLVLVEGTEMYDDYVAGDVTAPDMAEYQELLIAALEHLRPDIVVMRVTCDPPRGVKHEPSRLPDKASFVRDLVAELERRDTYQGRYWSEHADKG
jgi:radical SAM protein (TIGR01212 family)